jgi:hypothetical protein
MVLYLFLRTINGSRANVHAFAKTFSKIAGGANIAKRVNGSIIGFIHECGKEKTGLASI